MFIEKLQSRFPDYLAEDIAIIERTLDLSSKHMSYMPFDITLEKKILTIPTRIYSDKNQLDKLKTLSSTQKEIAYCFYSRHYDGFVREKCLKEFIASNNLFTIPYIIQLLGEYVIEILVVIYQNREMINKDNLIAYIMENPEHFEKTRQRVYSYWNCYYRRAYPKYRKGISPRGQHHLDYPAVKMLNYINGLLSKKY